MRRIQERGDRLPLCEECGNTSVGYKGVTCKVKTTTSEEYEGKPGEDDRNVRRMRESQMRITEQ